MVLSAAFDDSHRVCDITLGAHQDGDVDAYVPQHNCCWRHGLFVVAFARLTLLRNPNGSLRWKHAAVRGFVVMSFEKQQTTAFVAVQHCNIIACLHHPFSIPSNNRVEGPPLLPTLASPLVAASQPRLRCRLGSAE